MSVSVRDDRPGQYAALANMLVSKDIGLSHVRLIGEILVADASLNAWLYSRGKNSMAIDEWVDWAEQYTEYEDRYISTWKQLAETDPKDMKRSIELLQGLEVALNDAAEALRKRLAKFQEAHP